MDSTELGEHLARLVWESFSDFLEDGPRWRMLLDTEEQRRAFVAEEVLILFMWIHTRACQQAFGGRVPPEALRDMLDTLHRNVFEDLEAHGIARETLPLFEQRVSARYTTYYAAASDAAPGDAASVSEMAAQHLTGSPAAGPALTAALAEWTAATAGPLRDFLEEISLEPA